MNMKLASWNVNGIRAIVGKDFDASLAQLDADVLGIQEQKHKTTKFARPCSASRGWRIIRSIRRPLKRRDILERRFFRGLSPCR